MTEHHEEPSRGVEYPSLEGGQPPDADAPVDYPADPGLPPAVAPAAYAGVAGAYPSMPYQHRPGTNGKAIAGLVLALLGVVFCGVPSIAGLILGAVAMRETKRSGQSGHGIALAGTIIGIVVTGLWGLYWLLVGTIALSGWQWI